MVVVLTQPGFLWMRYTLPYVHPRQMLGRLSQLCHLFPALGPLFP